MKKYFAVISLIEESTCITAGTTGLKQRAATVKTSPEKKVTVTDWADAFTARVFLPAPRD